VPSPTPPPLKSCLPKEKPNCSLVVAEAAEVEEVEEVAEVAEAADEANVLTAEYLSAIAA